jgi:hypothetical protein
VLCVVVVVVRVDGCVPSAYVMLLYCCTAVLLSGCCAAVLLQALSVLGSIAAHPHHFRHVLKSLLDR